METFSEKKLTSEQYLNDVKLKLNVISAIASHIHGMGESFHAMDVDEDDDFATRMAAIMFNIEVDLKSSVQRALDKYKVNVEFKI